MFSLAVAVVAIALPDCINPSLIGAELLLVGGEHPARRTTEFALAAFIVTLLVGLVLALGLGDLILSVVPKPGPTLKYALFVAGGIVLLAGGAFVWIRRRALGSSGPSPEPRAHSHGSPVLLGAGIAGFELLTAFPYFAAIAMITGARIGSPGKLSLLVLYCVVYTLPLFGIAAACLLLGPRAERALRPIVDWLFGHWPAIAGPLAAVIGVGLIAYGVLRLSST
jgi:hypothetical protein